MKCDFFLVGGSIIKISNCEDWKITKKYHVLFDWLLITVIDLTPFHLIIFQMDAASFRPNQNPFHELRFGGSDGKQRGQIRTFLILLFKRRLYSVFYFSSTEMVLKTLLLFQLIYVHKTFFFKRLASKIGFYVFLRKIKFHLTIHCTNGHGYSKKEQLNSGRLRF